MIKFNSRQEDFPNQRHACSIGAMLGLLTLLLDPGFLEGCLSIKSQESSLLDVRELGQLAFCGTTTTNTFSKAHLPLRVAARLELLFLTSESDLCHLLK